MAAKPKANSCQATLVSTQLKKLSVITILSPKDSGKGTLELAMKTSRVAQEKDQNTVLILLEMQGRGLNEGKSANPENKIAFTIDAAIEGKFSLSVKPAKDELQGCETYLADYLMPILSDMIETLLSKCGYVGIALPRSFEYKSESAEVVASQQKK